MRIDPSAPTPPDQATNDPARLVPTDSTAAPVTAAPVTISEIAEFLRHLADLSTSGRNADPDARAAFLHRKAELFTRLDTDSAGPVGPLATRRRTP